MGSGLQHPMRLRGHYLPLTLSTFAAFVIATIVHFTLTKTLLAPGLHFHFKEHLPLDPEVLRRCFDQHGREVLEDFYGFEEAWADGYVKGNDSDPSRRLLYFPVPKAMSASLRYMMRDYGLRSRKGQVWEYFEGIFEGDLLPTNALTDAQRNYFSMTFLREPIAREIDGFLESIPIKHIEGAAQNATLLNDFAMRFGAGDNFNLDIHIAPSLYLLFRFASRRSDMYEPPHFIGKVENVTAHLEQLARELERRQLFVSPALRGGIEHANEAVDRHSSRQLLTKKSIRALCRRLCLDYKCLQYNLPRECEHVAQIFC